MDMLKKLFIYFIIVLIFYIFSNIVIAHIIQPPKVEANDDTEVVSSTDFDWEEMSKDPMFWFIALGGIIVTLP